MKKALLLLILSTIFSSCGQPAPSTTSIQESIATEIATPFVPTPSQTSLPSYTATPAEWIRTYATKKPLVVYGGVARTQFSAEFYNRGYFDFGPILVLYADGQLILSGRTKQLTSKETDEILVKLDQLGIFQIQTTYADDMQNPIYILPTEQVPPYYISLGVIVVNGKESKTIIYKTEWEEYLIQPMQDIISYLESFSTEGTTLYQPDRLLVGFVMESEIPIPEDATVIPWPSGITPPSESSQFDGVLYLEGAEALTLFNVKEENPDAYFTFARIRFQVYLRPIYPHECQIYRYYPDPNQPFFTCDDW